MANTGLCMAIHILHLTSYILHLTSAITTLSVSCQSCHPLKCPQTPCTSALCQSVSLKRTFSTYPAQNRISIHISCKFMYYFINFKDRVNLTSFLSYLPSLVTHLCSIQSPLPWGGGGGGSHHSPYPVQSPGFVC